MNGFIFFLFYFFLHCQVCETRAFFFVFVLIIEMHSSRLSGQRQRGDSILKLLLHTAHRPRPHRLLSAFRNGTIHGVCFPIVFHFLFTDGLCAHLPNINKFVLLNVLFLFIS